MSSSTETAISVQNVAVRYRLARFGSRRLKQVLTRLPSKTVSIEEVWALRDVSFTVAAGEAFGVVGRNGAGKSTLLKTMAGVIKPTQGTVTTQGRLSPLLELGTGFDYELTGQENVILNGCILGLSRKEMAKRLPAIAEFAELGAFMSVPLARYSTGMVARLGFAIAISVDPHILLVDEVLSVGDEAFQQKCRDRIQSFRRAGVTMVLVSHSSELISVLCDRAVWLDEGKVAALGDARDIAYQYHTFAQGARRAETGNAYYFHPEWDVTRAEMVAMIVRAKRWPLIAPATPAFVDVQPSHPFYPYIEAARAHFVVSGRSADLFQPAATLTRAELAVMLARAAEGMERRSDAADCPDVSNTAWYLGAVRYVLERKLMATVDGLFQPSAEVTRLDAARAMVALTQLAPRHPPSPSFADVAPGPDYGVIEAALQAGIVMRSS